MLVDALDDEVVGAATVTDDAMLESTTCGIENVLEAVLTT